MENSAQQKKITELGKLLVKQLGMEDSVDTLGRWMAHYIAELIVVAGKARGKAKQAADEQCAAAILKLWSHRSMLPSGKRPLENFEPIFELLDKIRPDAEPSYYVQVDGDEKPVKKSIKHTTAKSGNDWLKAAKEVDKVARVWIHYALKKAAMQANTGAEKKILKNTISLPVEADVKIIRILLDIDDDLDLEAPAHQKLLKKEKKEKINERIKELENFTALNNMILKSYKNELAELSK